MVDFRKASEKCEAIVSLCTHPAICTMRPPQQPAKSVRLRLFPIRFLTWIAVYSSDLLMMWFLTKFFKLILKKKEMILKANNLSTIPEYRPRLSSDSSRAERDCSGLASWLISNKKVTKSIEIIYFQSW